jgi:branched-chain amino acid transport system substrate-binding protein
MCGRDDAHAPAAVKFIKEALKAKTIFIVDDKTTYSQGLADGVAKSCKEMGITVLAHEHVNQGDKDFSAVLTMAKNENPDVFYMSLQNYSPGSMMAIQAKRMGISSHIMAQDAVYHPNFIDVAKDAAEGVYFTFGFTDQTTDAYKKYEKIFTAEYGKIGAYATYAYDAAMALLKAIKAAGSTDPAKIKAELLKLNYPGASKHVQFNENLDSGSSYIVFKTEGGKFVPHWSPEKGFLK